MARRRVIGCVRRHTHAQCVRPETAWEDLGRAGGGGARPARTEMTAERLIARRGDLGRGGDEQGRTGFAVRLLRSGGLARRVLAWDARGWRQGLARALRGSMDLERRGWGKSVSVISLRGAYVLRACVRARI